MSLRLALIVASLTTSMAMPAYAQNQSQIGTVKRGQSCAGCNLFQADLSGLDRAGLNLSRSRLRQADMSLATLNRARFDGADLRDIQAYGAVFAGANFSGSNLSNASLVGTWMQNSNLSSADLSGANLSGADLRGARGLTQSQLNKACGDGSTQLPSGLRIPTC